MEQTADHLKTAAAKPGLSAGAAGQMLAGGEEIAGVERQAIYGGSIRSAVSSCQGFIH